MHYNTHIACKCPYVSNLTEQRRKMNFQLVGLFISVFSPFFFAKTKIEEGTNSGIFYWNRTSTACSPGFHGSFIFENNLQNLRNFKFNGGKAITELFQLTVQWNAVIFVK